MDEVKFEITTEQLDKYIQRDMVIVGDRVPEMRALMAGGLSPEGLEEARKDAEADIQFVLQLMDVHGLVGACSRVGQINARLRKLTDEVFQGVTNALTPLTPFLRTAAATELDTVTVDTNVLRDVKAGLRDVAMLVLMFQAEEMTKRQKESEEKADVESAERSEGSAG